MPRTPPTAGPGRLAPLSRSPLLPSLPESGYMASARRWRAEAEHLRDMALEPHLINAQRALLLREAEAADRQATWWLEASADQ